MLRQWLEPVLTRSWQQRGWLARALWPFSQLYGRLLRMNNAAHRAGTTAQATGNAKIIIVGNVIAGGSGKTPVVMALLRHLQSRGLKVGVISRGYGRTSRDCREVHPDDSADTVGDEPSLIRHATGVPVVVAADRQEAANMLVQKHPTTQLILSDDGLQHLGLHRDLELCIFDDRGIGNGWLLPAGPLREPWPRAVDLVLHTGNSPAFPGYRAYRRLSSHAIQANGHLVDLQSWSNQGTRRLLAVAGIAKPQEFFDMLHQVGLRPSKTLALPDHYIFNSNHINEFKGYDLICTEKDAKKLWRFAPHALAIPLVLEFEPAFLTAFDAHVDQLLGTPLSSGHGHTTA